MRIWSCKLFHQYFYIGMQCKQKKNQPNAYFAYNSNLLRMLAANKRPLMHMSYVFHAGIFLPESILFHVDMELEKAEPK